MRRTHAALVVCMSLLACGANAAEAAPPVRPGRAVDRGEREQAEGGAEAAPEADARSRDAAGSRRAGRTAGVRRGAGTNFVIGAVVLAAAVVATAVGLSRKPRVRVIRRGAAGAGPDAGLPGRPPDGDDAGG